MTTETETKKPAQTFRKGTVKAAVWENTGRDGVFYSVTFSRSYKAGEDGWRNTSSFNGGDLEALADVAFQARLYIMKTK
jgi:hypothetical protein